MPSALSFSEPSRLVLRLAILALAVLLINLAAWLAGERLFIDEARHLDRENTLQKAQWIENLLEREGRNLQRVILGRADRLARDANVLRSGLRAVDFHATISEIYLAGANIDALLIEAADKTVLFGRRRDTATDLLYEMSAAEQTFLGALPDTAAGANTSFYGLVVTPEGAVALVAGMPVAGPSHYGWLIARRDLNARQVSTYGTIVNIPFTLSVVPAGLAEEEGMPAGIVVDPDDGMVRWRTGSLNRGASALELSIPYGSDYEQHMTRVVTASRSGILAVSLIAGVALALWMRSRQLIAQRLESSRREVERMARLAAVGELAAGVAHEVNNPNGMIQRNLEFVEDVIGDALALLSERHDADRLELGGVDFTTAREQLPQLLEDMVRGSRRIGDIVRDLKDFARDDGLVNTSAFDLNEAVTAAIRLQGGTIRKTTDYFTDKLDPDLPPVSGNLRQVEQVILNLVQNACQSLPDRNSAIAVTSRYDAARHCNVVEVADEGGGMTAEQCERVFEPFFTTRRESGGTGLGLSVSLRIVKRHGGTLEIVSSPGNGTVVTMRLPVAKEDP